MKTPKKMTIKTSALAALMIVSGSAMAQMNDTAKGDVDVYFVRHGQTIFNKYNRVQGWSDTPLTAEGIKVAQAFGAGSASINFKRYYSSDLGRQRETLALIMHAHKSHQVPVERQELREVFFGGFEGLPNRTMNSAAGKALGLVSDDAMTTLLQQGKMPLTDLANAIHKADDKQDAEHAAQVRERMQKALHDMVMDALQHHDKNILAVSSGMSIGIMISDMTDNPLKNRGMSNAAVVKIEYRDGNYTVRDIGDMRFVNEGQKIISKEEK
ncbi:histidine phosphatase family protein (plasmid) [Enterobacter mori]|uniref:histidine phosphatase family protein n=1 Tax=Enterobacter mori TaxID=539813 RepID=UPI001ED9C894|nr:histidine phosphatase family protein [Enterobacter mori]UKJ23755.1 histidine phosphatase family protein [Enterobacter mori]